MPRRPHSVFEEPHFSGVPASQEVAEHEVWSEPGLLPDACPADPAQTYAGQLRARWLGASPAQSWFIVLALALASGPFAILSAFMKASAPGFVLAAVVVAPLVEELGKAAAPLITLERWPYRFASGAQPVLVCVASGLVFAAIENLLYLHVYVRDPSPALAAWRWSVCTALHVGCSLIAGLGLRRVWLAARAGCSRPDISGASAYLITAIALHGAYNAVALVLQGSSLLSFGR